VRGDGITMKIAVPLFRKRVAPHFGVSSSILLLETKGPMICGETIWEVSGEGPMDIARDLVKLGVERLICGGIQRYYKDWLMGKGITVVDNQRGVAKEIVQQLLKMDHSEEGFGLP